MKTFYKVSVTKQSDGTAIVHKEPPLQGEIITKITDSSTAGDFKIVALECTEEQHEENLAYPGVVALDEAEAVKLAPKYQPKRSFTELNPRTGKEEKLELPAADLTRLLQIKEERATKGGSEKKSSPPKKKISRKKASAKPAQ